MSTEERIREAMKLLIGGYIEAAYEQLEEALRELAKVEEQRG